jgi:hypothetical protein
MINSKKELKVTKQFAGISNDNAHQRRWVRLLEAT